MGAVWSYYLVLKNLNLNWNITKYLPASSYWRGAILYYLSICFCTPNWNSLRIISKCSHQFFHLVESYLIFFYCKNVCFNGNMMFCYIHRSSPVGFMREKFSRTTSFCIKTLLKSKKSNQFSRKKNSTKIILCYSLRK